MIASTLGIPSFLEALADPAMRHAMLVHAPIMFAIVAVPVALFAAILRDNRTLRVVALVTFALLLGSTFVTVESGESAYAAVEAQLDEEVYAVLEEHEELAETIWMLALAGTLLTGLGLLRARVLATSASWLAVVVGVAAAGLVGWTAHHGGTLVYVHGVGAGSEARDAVEQTRAVDADPRLAFYREEVRGLLAARCMRCHNPVGAQDAGRLDLTSMRAMLRGGWSGAALVPGDPDASLMIERVRSDDLEIRMPPPEDPPLTEEEIAVLERWIAEGSAWAP